MKNYFKSKYLAYDLAFTVAIFGVCWYEQYVLAAFVAIFYFAGVLFTFKKELCK